MTKTKVMTTAAQPVEVVKESAVGISINVQFAAPEPAVTGAKQMVIQTHFAQGETYGKLDDLFREVDYHSARYEIIALEDSLRRVRFQMEDKMQQLDDFQRGERDKHATTGRKSEYHMTQQVATQVNRMLNLIERDKNEEVRLNQEIAKRQKMVDEHNAKKSAA